jgi:superfamily II DNA or RNA helicase
MEPATTLQKVSFRKKPRAGQDRVFDALVAGRNQLNIKLPTGYGKTYTAAGVYSILQKRGRVNRLLYIVSNDAQLNQFYNDGRCEFEAACVDGPLKIIDVGFSSHLAIREHRGGLCQVFVITIQSLRETRGANNVSALLQTGQWMVCIDEYHHYGIDRSWGRAALALNRAFLLCMSATPSRPDDDSAFGNPDIQITYRDANDEEAVKPLKGYSYNYRMDFESDGETVSCTTKDLTEMAGGDTPEKIERFTIKRRMRWSPDYISPLVSNPIERMQRERIQSGHKLQALIVAMCVSHAKLVCEQIQAAYPELMVDWVGTGEDGRSSEINRAVLERFCPPKNAGGVRTAAELDILVNVGIAGEGLDCINVSEIVFLNNAALNNKNLQICGRAARYLPGVTGHINFDASSELSQQNYLGAAIMDAMDYAAPHVMDDQPQEPSDDEYEPLPDEPFVQIYNMELIEIDSGDEGVQRMARILKEHDPHAFDYEGLFADSSHPEWDTMTQLYRGVRAREASAFNEKAKIAQLRDDVEGAVSGVTRLAMTLCGARKHPFARQLAGKTKHEINKRKIKLFGSIKGINDETVLRKHYGWVKQLERDILLSGVPEWLSKLFK